LCNHWLLEEGGAKITDTIVVHGESLTLWSDHNLKMTSAADDAESTSLLKVMVLLDDSPSDLIAKLSPQHVEIAIWARKIRALRPLYLEQQQASIYLHCPVPAVL
jgi:hypothetical protein